RAGRALRTARRGHRRCTHARALAPRTAGRAHGRAAPLHRRAGRLAAVPEWRAASAPVGAIARTLSSSAARSEPGDRRALQLLAGAAPLRVSAGAGTGRPHGQRTSARPDRDRSAAPLAAADTLIGARTDRAGTGADCRAALRAFLPDGVRSGRIRAPREYPLPGPRLG